MKISKRDELIDWMTEEIVDGFLDDIYHDETIATDILKYGHTGYYNMPTFQIIEILRHEDMVDRATTLGFVEEEK